MCPRLASVTRAVAGCVVQLCALPWAAASHSPPFPMLLPDSVIRVLPRPLMQLQSNYCLFFCQFYRFSLHAHTDS